MLRVGFYELEIRRSCDARFCSGGGSEWRVEDLSARNLCLLLEAFAQQRMPSASLATALRQRLEGSSNALSPEQTARSLLAAAQLGLDGDALLRAAPSLLNSRLSSQVLADLETEAAGPRALGAAVEGLLLFFLNAEEPREAWRQPLLQALRT